MVKNKKLFFFRWFHGYLSSIQAEDLLIEKAQGIIKIINFNKIFRNFFD